MEEIEKIAVFLDRDGTVNEEMGYINHISRLRIFPNAIKAIKRLNKRGLKTFIITNQSGVARGFFPYSLVEDIHKEIIKGLKKEGAYIDGIYWCPHHPQGSIKPYAALCDCRKPKPGLLKKAANEHHIILDKSYVVGDKVTDIITGKNIGAKTILVLTGYGRGECEYILPNSGVKPDYIADDLLDAVDCILEDLAV